MGIQATIEMLREKYPEYAYMRYKVDTKEHAGDNWLKANFGLEAETHKEIILTTDHIHCSEDSGTARTDAELVCALLNMFCNEKAQ